MAKDLPKTRKLTAEDARRRLSYGVCPACGDHLIVKRPRVSQDDEGNVRIQGAFHACTGPLGWECYYLSDDVGRERETTTAPALAPRVSRPAGAAGVIRRRKSA